MTEFKSLTENARVLFATRRTYSQAKLESLSSALEKSDKVKAISELCIFAAGSYGRLEASEHSDVDLFFITRKTKSELGEYNVPSIQMFSDVIDAGYKQSFPKFSNDGQFLQLLFLNEIENNLGSRNDDFLNHFTSRILLLLESRPVYGADAYSAILKSVIDSYFRDYTHHPKDFKPTFLVNDIIRFWKTLCLNYEHGRNQETERDKIKQKIKNFKLKFSRLMTCFATMAYLSTFKDTITPDNVFAVCQKTPSERVRALVEFDVSIEAKLVQALEEYAWFIELTGLHKDKLEEHFSDKDRRTEAFKRSQDFGDHLFDVLLQINTKNNMLRYMVL